MSDDNRNFHEWAETLSKGVIAGGAIGIIAHLVGIMDWKRGVVLGGLCGVLAMINVKQRRDAKRKRQ